eukprot:TRINITY_DN6257_c0_g1_i2.p1 TRINITY_DN6257_c0_g1~~TRINITY_DN6257_c0_g1_i2.p1  ORF type:complete len:158 (+),score=11.87 TRINITY_DN6257_c0_g1_i2:65-538(+)
MCIRDRYMGSELGLPLVQETFHGIVATASQVMRDTLVGSQMTNFTYYFMGLEIPIDVGTTMVSVLDNGVFKDSLGTIIGYPSPVGPRRDIDLGSSLMASYINAEYLFAIKSFGFDNGYFSWNLNKENYYLDDSFKFTAGDLARVVPRLLDTVIKLQT